LICFPPSPFTAQLAPDVGKKRLPPPPKSYLLTITCHPSALTEIKKLKIPKSELQFGEKIGEGSFATVFKYASSHTTRGCCFLIWYHRGEYKGETVAIKQINFSNGLDEEVVVKFKEVSK